jgi:hypothetical protein
MIAHFKAFAAVAQGFSSIYVHRFLYTHFALRSKPLSYLVHILNIRNLGS